MTKTDLPLPSVDQYIAPVKLIERIAKFRAKEVAEREKAKAVAPKTR